MSQGVAIVEEALPDGFNAGNNTVGETEQALAADYPVRKYVIIHADAANTDPILIGTQNNSANGFVLKPGETAPPIPLDNVSKIFITGAASDPAYSWLSI